MSLHSYFENRPESTPLAAHPPTPSATTIKVGVTTKASSPPLFLLSSCGMLQIPVLKIKPSDDFSASLTFSTEGVHHF